MLPMNTHTHTKQNVKEHDHIHNWAAAMVSVMRGEEELAQNITRHFPSIGHSLLNMIEGATKELHFYCPLSSFAHIRWDLTHGIIATCVHKYQTYQRKIICEL